MVQRLPLVNVGNEVRELPAGDTLDVAIQSGVDFPFLSASSTWTINHNFGYYPVVQLRTLGGNVFGGQVDHVSVNQAVATFVSPIAGYARCT
jgi:hypothetical protein